jgi:hypothetical protein
MRRLAITILALGIVPTMLAAQTDSSRMRGTDTTHARTGRRQMSSGAIGERNYGLARDQVTQLQTALKQADCDPGPIDGVIGRRTRSAMNCARQKNNITGNNPNDLFRSLNLSFTTSDSLGRGSANRGMRRMHPDSSMSRSMRDTTRRRPTTKKDTTRGPNDATR